MQAIVHPICVFSNSPAVLTFLYSGSSRKVAVCLFDNMFSPGMHIERNTDTYRKPTVKSFQLYQLESECSP